MSLIEKLFQIVPATQVAQNIVSRGKRPVHKPQAISTNALYGAYTEYKTNGKEYDVIDVARLTQILKLSSVDNLTRLVIF